ncbi:Neurexin-1a [Liparis tanakae]|uniref:Neurexin-1a n=1 Tax=Liparis tanakae TaxID=230148 RepID=A0A4Z2H2Y8_9TELE|nr:Neurexin-1a [Liparis tanakae]
MKLKKTEEYSKSFWTEDCLDGQAASFAELISQQISTCLEFTGAEGQWARFPVWNACCESEMSFNMKTKSSHGLLVYFDDEGFCDFLELLILNGKLSLRFSIFCAEPATVVSDTAVNDSQWHAVTIRRNFKNTTLKVDNENKWVEVKSKRRDMTVFSHLFVGGIPPELRSVALRLTSAAVKDQPPFTGWITDIKVNNTESVMNNSEGVLKDLCGSANMCLNGGVCSIINNEPSCDCSRTGFQGMDCSEGLAHLMMGDQALQIQITCALPTHPKRENELMKDISSRLCGSWTLCLKSEGQKARYQNSTFEPWGPAPSVDTLTMLVDNCLCLVWGVTDSPVRMILLCFYPVFISIAVERLARCKHLCLWSSSDSV